MDKFNVQESIKAQKDFCERESLPHFAPRSGKCFSCNRNIYELVNKKYNPGTKYEKEVTSGISIESASNELVTGCPHCNRTYCD